MGDRMKELRTTQYIRIMQDIIKNGLSPFAKPFDLEKVMYYDSESGRIKLTQAQYVFSYYQHFEQSKSSSPLMNILYAMVMRTNVGLDQIFFLLTLHTTSSLGRLNNNQFDYRNPHDRFFKTMAMVINRGISKNGIFIILLDMIKTINGHRCAILFSKAKDVAHTIHVYAYDPNGYNTESNDVVSVSMHAYIASLIVALSANTTYTFVFKPVSYFGMHFMNKHNPGLCVMFTYLWLYIVLIMKRLDLDLETVFQIDLRIAEYAANKLNTPGDIRSEAVANLLLSIAFNLALKLIDKYVIFFPKHDFITRMNHTTHHFQKELKARKIHLVQKSPREKRSPILPSASPRIQYGKECKKSDECETSYCNRKTYTCDDYPFDHDSTVLNKQNVGEFLDVSLQLYLEYVKSQNLEPVPPPHDLLYDWYTRLPPLAHSIFKTNFDTYKAMFYEEYASLFTRPNSSSGSKRGAKKSKLE